MPHRKPAVQKEQINNPFHELLVTELFEDTSLYEQLFSHEILVGETLELFQPINVVLSGPLGSGKTMLLNLIRVEVLAEFFRKHGKPPGLMEHLKPYFGVGINLVLTGFHCFGRRSVSASRGSTDLVFDCASAADFVNTVVFSNFLTALQFVNKTDNSRLRRWLGLEKSFINDELIKNMARLECWNGYYETCKSIDALRGKVDGRIKIWRDFLNTNRDDIPQDVWTTKTDIGVPMQLLGKILRDVSTIPRLPLFVVIDQYEVLPELNARFGTDLQRVINTAIKARDPMVFYKIGARTYDWGNELKIWGADSRIELQRDYVVINLAEVLMRTEEAGRAIFPKLATDITVKRLRFYKYEVGQDEGVKGIFGSRKPSDESQTYFRRREKAAEILLQKLPTALRDEIVKLCGGGASPLEIRLAAAWVLQKMRRKIPPDRIREMAQEIPWVNHRSWRKARIEIALLQIASAAHRSKSYAGWQTVLMLSGYNITAYLYLVSKIWDWATKLGHQPLKAAIPDSIQSEGIYQASKGWRDRDRNEPGSGSHRFEVVGRLGPAIYNEVVMDDSISNPGHTGFSLRDTDFDSDGNEAEQVKRFIKRAVSWGILEERDHTSRYKEHSSRRTFYLHPLFSPVFAIPYGRHVDPIDIGNIKDIHKWLFDGEPIILHIKQAKS